MRFLLSTKNMCRLEYALHLTYQILNLKYNNIRFFETFFSNFVQFIFRYLLFFCISNFRAIFKRNYFFFIRQQKKERNYFESFFLGYFYEVNVFFLRFNGNFRSLNGRHAIKYNKHYRTSNSVKNTGILVVSLPIETSMI